VCSPSSLSSSAGAHAFQSIHSISRADSMMLRAAADGGVGGLTDDELKRAVAARNARLVGDMLELTLRNVVTTKSKLDKLSRTIEDTEELIRLQLDLARNEMLKLEMLLTIGTFCAGIGAVIVGVFGMNLTSHAEDHPSAFYIVCTALGAILVTTFMLVWAFASSRGLL
jgi:magnesium transporter